MIPIADAHCHLWDLEHHRYPWLERAEPEGPFGKTARIRHTYLLDDYRADAANQDVRRMVHVEAGWDPADPLGEIAWIQSLHDRYGAPHGHVAHVDLTSSDVADLLDRHADFAVFCGVRDRLFEGDFTDVDVSDTCIDDTAWLRGMAELDRRGLVFDLQAPAALAEKAAALVKNHPGVHFVLTGAGYPPSPDDAKAFGCWRDGLAALAEAPNLVIKLSCLPLTERRWVPEHAEQAARVVIGTFGASRVLLASNFPVDRLFASMDDVFGQVRRWIEDLPESDQHGILYDNTVRTYCLDSADEP